MGKIRLKALTGGKSQIIVDDLTDEQATTIMRLIKFSGDDCSCGKWFKKSHANQRYCSDKCKIKYYKRRIRVKREF